MVEAVVFESHQIKRKEASVSAGWAWLPSELLELILDKLVLICDYIQFGAVCKHWQSAAKQHKQQWMKFCHKQLPMLMQITRNRNKSNAAFFSISQGGMLRQLSYVPHYNKKGVELYSSHGWLAYNDKLVLTFLNPFTGDTISLPPIIEPTDAVQDILDSPSTRIYQVALSADPCLNPNVYEVLVQYWLYPQTLLAHFNSADATWTQIGDTSLALNVLDALYYKGQFVALTVFNEEFPSIYVSGITTTYQQSALGTARKYIVESSAGDLLLVRIKGFESDEKSIQVYKLLRAARGRPKWVEIESIGTDVLFLGGGEPICVSALEFPECHPNSIYFTDGVFYLENRRMERHNCVNKHKERTLLWILPTIV
ncbi:probable F-box protein At1g44080 [Rosa rugosa]|uniref:probable F-box protein At1g44080 n=1 Tax=Rosa rugosa TaxID=74645 RepID=UPI002B4088D0|nr:probable F-box protein At1g44080 [Rosa rugosa]